MRGKFYVFDGIDGSGSETQSKLLLKLLDDKGMPYLFLDYPDYGKPIGNFIHNYLYGNEQIPADVKFILHSADKLKDREAIESALADGKTVVACRYATTMLDYQEVEGVDAEKALQHVRLMDFPVPDLAIYLKIGPETTAKRKMKEKGNLDRNEANLQLLSKVAARYDEMAKQNVFCKWIIVDGEKSVDHIFGEVRKAVGL